MKMNHLSLLILHLLPHGGKHLEVLIVVEQRLVLDSQHPEWRHSVRMRVLCIGDVDIGWADSPLGQPLLSLSPFSLEHGVNHSMVEALHDGAMLVMQGSFRGRSMIFNEEIWRIPKESIHAQNRKVDVAKSQRSQSQTQRKYMKIKKEKNHTQREKIHYVNGDYNMVL